MPKYTENDPLHLAAELGQIDRVQELICSGVKVDVRDRYNVTPLMVAAGKGHDEIVQVLLDAGANVNARERAMADDIGKRTPLHFACEIGRVRTIRLLLKHGADPDAANQLFETPLSNALLLGASRNQVDSLLEYGANPNGPEKCWDPPVVAAAGKGDVDALSLILSKGVDVNRIGQSGENALGYTQSLECARLLLQHGADVNLKNGEGKTPLLQNIYAGSVELLRCLIEAGADVNVADQDGITVIEKLADRPDVELANLFVEFGAKINEVSPEGLSILDYFLWIDSRRNESTDRGSAVNRKRIIEFLKSKGAKTADELGAKKKRRQSSRCVAIDNRLAENPKFKDRF